MNKIKIVNKLKELYPDANIVLNDDSNPTEIVAEVSPEKGIAVAVIDKSIAHHHNHTKEKYTVLKGEIDIYVDGVKKHLKEKDSLIIKPKKVHYAVGNETWVEVVATPPWSPEDHILEG